jgi:hypothetical protein
MLITLGVAVNAPDPPPAVTVNVTGMMVAVPPPNPGVTVILPVYALGLLARFAAFAVTVIVTGFVLNSVLTPTVAVSQGWSDASVKEIPVVLRVERETVVVAAFPAAAESGTVAGAARIGPLWPPLVPLVKVTVKVMGVTPVGAVGVSRTTAV